MAALTTAAIIGAAVVGTAATVHSVNQQKKAARKQEAAINKQTEDAKIAAKNEAGLDAARLEGGADVKLGRGAATATPTSGGAGQGGATNRNGSVSARVGGVKPNKKAGLMSGQSTSGRIGL